MFPYCYIIAMLIIRQFPYVTPGNPHRTLTPRLCAQEELSLYHSIVQEIQSAQEEGVKDTKWASWKAGFVGWIYGKTCGLDSGIYHL